ncbi:hypothetical protein BH23CYA1_BH23CYA1_09080 [soil metagenome]
MFTLSTQGAAASTVPAAEPIAEMGRSSIPPAGLKPEPGQVRHLLFGTPSIVQSTIQHLYSLGYAEPNDWSRPLSTGRPGEVMAILTKRIGPG